MMIFVFLAEKANFDRDRLPVKSQDRNPIFLVLRATGNGKGKGVVFFKR
jgi:hypothetical protein